MGCFYPRTQSHETPDNDAERRRAQEREKKKGEEYGPSCIKQSNKQTNSPKGFKKKAQIRGSTPVLNPALQRFRHGGTKKRSCSDTASPTAASARGPVSPS